MRTTLDIDKPVLDGLKALQRGRKETLGQIASRLLAQALSAETVPVRKAKRLNWISQPMGARVDLADKDALYRILDEQT